MPYEFTECEQEPEAQPSSGRTGGPQRKSAGIGALDPPVPPKKPGDLFQNSRFPIAAHCCRNAARGHDYGACFDVFPPLRQAGLMRF